MEQGKKTRRGGNAAALTENERAGESVHAEHLRSGQRRVSSAPRGDRDDVAPRPGSSPSRQEPPTRDCPGRSRAQPPWRPRDSGAGRRTTSGAASVRLVSVAGSWPRAHRIGR
eukprot:scaffold407_cov251-Pinguiococcus_pyrenoidosus.AAC.38